MVQVSWRAGLAGSALTRLLAEMTDRGDRPDAAARGSHADFAARLGQWLSWTDAIALSAALDGPPSVTDRADTPPDEAGADAARTRAMLARGVAEDCAPAPPRPGRAPLPGERATSRDVPPDPAECRRRHQARQQAMDAAIAALRERLRQTLARRSPEMARLAAVDAAMERALGVQEHNLLARLPLVLERHVQQLATRHAGDDPAAGAPAWHARVRQDMQALMTAELALRFQPIEGLLQALDPTLPRAAGTPAQAAHITP